MFPAEADVELQLTSFTLLCSNCCSGGAALSLLEQILPYLIVKKPQAELAILFQNKLSNPADKADRNWQKETKDKMALLNHKGNQLTVSSGG